MKTDNITVEDLERDPYPVYQFLRDEAPVAYMPCLDAWMVTSWDAVSTALVAIEDFPAHVEGSPTDRALGGPSMMTSDGEAARYRSRPFEATFRPRAVERSMTEVFRTLCTEHLEGLEDGSDLVAEFFEPVSLVSLAHVLGIEDEVEVSTLRRWFSGLAAGISNYEGDSGKDAFCASVSSEIDTVLVPMFEQALAEPSASLVSDLINFYEGPLDQRLKIAMPSAKLVLMAGLQEPGHGGATLAYALMTHTEQLEAVKGDPGLIAPAVEEALRWMAPIGNLLRGVGADVELAGVSLPVGARVVLVVASANRDPLAWGPSADEFDINRPPKNHLSFAKGPHYCMGHHFARVQLRIATEMLFRRHPGLRLVDPSPSVFWGHEYRSPRSLVVEGTG